MSKRRNNEKVKPVEEWGVEEWKTAYETLNKKQQTLSDQLKRLFSHLHRALGQLQEIIN